MSTWIKLTLSAIAAAVAVAALGCSDSSKSTDPTIPDTSTPYIVSHYPPDTATNISTTPEIRVVFSEGIAPSSITDSSVIVYHGGQRAAGTIALANSIITFAPSAPLQNGFDYRVRVSGTLADPAGNHVRDTVISYFATEPYTATAPGCWVRSLSLDPDGSDGVFPHALVLTRDNAVVAAGGGTSPRIAKIDTTGNVLWVSEFDIGAYEYGSFSDIAQRSNGAFIMTGDRRDLDASGSEYAPFLTLVTEGGVPGTGFDKTIPSMNAGIAVPPHILNSPSDGYVIAGSSTDYLYRFRLLETNYFGTPIWQRSLGADVPQASERYYEQALTNGSDGGYVVCGYRHFGVIENSERYILKTDDTGAVIWEYAYGSGKLRAVCQAEDGGYYAVGDNIVMKVSSTGSLVWESNAIGGLGYGVTGRSEGGFVVCGMTVEAYTGNMILAAFDASGSLLWRKEPMSGGLVDVVETSSGSLVACGVYLIKTDSEGNL